MMWELILQAFGVLFFLAVIGLVLLVNNPVMLRITPQHMLNREEKEYSFTNNHNDRIDQSENQRYVDEEVMKQEAQTRERHAANDYENQS